jgi:hypothetical protein
MCVSCGCVLAGTGTPDDDHGDARNITRTRVRLAADAALIETVAAARNILASLGASELDDFDVAKSAEVGPVLKAEAERQFTLCLAWPVLKPDVAKAQDGRRDYARADVIEVTAWAWMAKSRSVGLYHRDGTEGHGTVVESYIYRGPDWQATPDTLIKAGDWIIGTIWDDVGWALWKTNLVNGMSPLGTAQRRPADPALIFDRS